MCDADKFEAVFNYFLRTGKFIVLDSRLSLKQLQAIYDHLLENVPRRTTQYYEIHLINVVLVPFHVEEFIEPLVPKERILSGPPKEEELPVVLRNRVASESEDITLRILDNIESPIYSQRTTPYFRKISYEYPKENVENTLLSLFKVAIWKSVNLESVVILGQERNYLNQKVINNLYDYLSPHSSQLIELRLKKVDLFNRPYLVNFLKKASNLEVLCLEDIQSVYNTKSNLVSKVCEGVAENLSLRRLDLRNVNLEPEDYSQLFALLKDNYHLKKIKLNEPFHNESLKKLHTQLMDEMEERSRKSSLVRFQENELTKENVYKLAEIGLECENSHPIKLSVNQNTKELMITHAHNRGLSVNLVEKLPERLRKHRNYLQRSWPLSLDINEFLYDQTTIGAVLLEKAYQLRKQEAMKLILSAGADLFEKLPNQLSLIQQVFSDNPENPLKPILINYVKNDLTMFASFLHIYNSNVEMSTKMELIKSELEKLITILIELDQLPLPLRILRDITLDTNKSGWEQDLRLIIQAIREEGVEFPLMHSTLDEFEKIINFLHTETAEAKKKWSSNNEFNNSLCGEVIQLLNIIQVYKHEITLNQTNEELIQQIKRHQLRIEKIIQNEIELKNNIDASLEIKNQIRAEIKAEMDNERKKYKAEIEEEMNKKLKELFEFFKANPPANTPSIDELEQSSEMQASSSKAFFGN